MNRSRLGIVVTASLVVVGAVAVVSEARGDAACGAVVPAGGGFGNAGFGAGYSMSRFGGGCGPVIACRPVCGPRWGGWCRPGWGWNVGCLPVCPPRPWCPPRCAPAFWSGSWCGSPAWNPCGWPVYGGTTWGFRDSVFVSVPAGGGMTFFSGTLVPYPVWGYPGGWGGFGWSPWLGAAARPGINVAGGGQRPQVASAMLPASRPVIAAAPRAQGRLAPIRASTGVARARAARLIARGDAQLREAGRDPTRLEAALASYRQAVAAAQDQPDALIRQAVVLEALDRREAAESVLDQAVAVDGRLASPAAAANHVAIRDGGPDPVFDGRPQADLPPLAARGIAILREIGAEAAGAGEPAPAIAWLTERWSARWGRGFNAVAASQP
jgi:hypothetical protein